MFLAVSLKNQLYQRLRLPKHWTGTFHIGKDPRKTAPLHKKKYQEPVVWSRLLVNDTLRTACFFEKIPNRSAVFHVVGKTFQQTYVRGSDPFFYKTKNALWTFFVLWRRVRDFHSSLRDPPPCGSAPAPPWTRVCSSIHRTLPLTTRPFRVRIPEDFYYKRKDVSRTSFRLWRRVRDSNPGSG